MLRALRPLRPRGHRGDLLLLAAAVPPLDCLTAAAATSMTSNSSASDSDDAAERVQSARQDRLAQRRAGQLHPPRAEIGDGRHRLDLDLLLGLMLDVAEQPVLARLGERDGDPFPSGASRAPDPVHVPFRGRGDVVVDHVRDVPHVEAPRGDVGRDQQVGLVGAERFHHAIAMRLRQSAVKRLGAEPARVQRLRQRVDFRARPAERRSRRSECSMSSTRPSAAILWARGTM